MVLGSLFRSKSQEAGARGLYQRIVAQARRAEFYTACGVPDTLDGRFDLVALHTFLVLRRLKQDHPDAATLGQALFDTMFLDMDQSLRELGAGDLGVGRRIKLMAQGFYGRIAAYEAGLSGAEADLEAALKRNLYGTVEAAPESISALAGYMRRETTALAAQNLAALAAGELAFGAPPDPSAGAENDGK